MSLLDTIKGAREEAKEAGTLLSSNKDGADAKASGNEPAEPTSTGFSRKSAASAKPTREAAGSVRAEGAKTSTADMTKEEKKAAREKRRSEEDLEYDAAQILLKQQEGYARTQRIWWILMIVGVICTIASWGIMRYMQSNGIENQSYMVLCIALMVLDYVLIIGDFIFDMVKVRPMRKKAQEQASGMTQRRKRRLIEEKETK